MSETYTVVGSDGSLEKYNDAFKSVTKEMRERAEELETQIVDYANQAEVAYLRIARALSEFKRDKLYLARGYESFRAWANSAEMKSVGSYRSAARLVQIADEALPILQKYNAMDALPPVATMGDLLPILNDEDGEKKFVEAVYAVSGLTNSDAKLRIKELRGLIGDHNEVLRPLFRLQLTRGTTWHHGVLSCSDGIDHYVVSSDFSIKAEHWAQFESMIGNHNVEVIE